MPTDLQRLLARFSANTPLDDGALKDLEEISGLALPQAYKAFLKFTNGGDGFVGKDRYIVLWPLDELSNLNEAYGVKEWAPGFFLFGTNGGGEAFAFDMRSRAKPIVSLPFVGMAIKAALPICREFEAFLKGEF